MSELESIPEELRIALRVPLIASSKEFQDVWYVQRYLMRLKARQMLTHEIRKYCDDDVKEKILQDENEYLGIILRHALKRILAYLRTRDYDFCICAYLSKDPYLPRWEGITILINTTYRNFRERMRIWREIEQQLTELFNQFRRNDSRNLEKIDEANEIIATTVEKL